MEKGRPPHKGSGAAWSQICLCGDILPFAPTDSGSTPSDPRPHRLFLRPGGCVLVRNSCPHSAYTPSGLCHRWHTEQIQSVKMFDLASTVFEIGISCQPFKLVGDVIFLKVDFQRFLKTQKTWCFVSTFRHGNWGGSSVAPDYLSELVPPPASSWVPWSTLGLLSEFAKAGPGTNPVLE